MAAHACHYGLQLCNMDKEQENKPRTGAASPSLLYGILVEPY